MAGIDLTTAQTMLDAYVAAETAVLSGQSYTIGGRALTRANLREIRDGRRDWEKTVQRLSSGAPASGMRVRGITPTG